MSTGTCSILSLHMEHFGGFSPPFLDKYKLEMLFLLLHRALEADVVLVGHGPGAAIRVTSALPVTSLFPAAGVGPEFLWGRLGVVSEWFLPWLVALQPHVSVSHPSVKTEIPALYSGQGLGGIL